MPLEEKLQDRIAWLESENHELDAVSGEMANDLDVMSAWIQRKGLLNEWIHFKRQYDQGLVIIEGANIPQQPRQ